MYKYIFGIYKYLKKESLFGDLMHNTLKTLIFIVSGVFVFLLLFKPYILNAYPLFPRLILITGYSFIAAISYALSYALLAPHNKLKWTGKLELGLLSLCFLIAWLLIWAYTVLNVELLFEHLCNLTNLPPLPHYFVPVSLFYTLVTGLLLYLVIHSYDIIRTFERLSGGKETPVDHWTIRKKRLNCLPSMRIRLRGKSYSNSIEMDSIDFIAAEVDGYHIIISYLNEEGHTDQYKVRNSLIHIEKQLSKVDKLVRCHKSFIVNLTYLRTAFTDTCKNKSFR